MGQRRIGQASLAEALLPAGAGSNRRLERIAGLIDWAPMERLLAPLRAPIGRPGYPPLALFRALLLAQWYQLSDPGLEEALADRLSFRRFCGFGLDDGTPDETTLCRFRGALAERGLAEVLFAELNRQLDMKGLVLKAGTLIDATLVEAAVARPPQSEGEVSTRDPEAGFTRRGQRSFFGFKAHVAVDLGSDLIRDAVLTGNHRSRLSWDQRVSRETGCSSLPPALSPPDPTPGAASAGSAVTGTRVRTQPTRRRGNF
jgi:transposase